MTVGIADVRVEICDTVEPYQFSDERISLAIAESVESMTRKGITSDRAVRLNAAIDLIDISVNSTSERNAQSITEGSKSITYADRTSIRTTLQDKLDREIESLSSCFDMTHSF